VTNGNYGAYAATDTGMTNNNGTDEVIDYTLNNNHQDYINVFPSVQFKYAFTDQFQMRAAYSTGIGRPGFQQISAADTITVGGATNGDAIAVNQGNPNLKPTTGNSFDLTAEYYGPHDSTFSGGLFYKTFTNYIFQTINDGSVIYQGVETPAQITSYQNVSGAYAEGLELDAHRRFYELISPFDGLGIDGNITFVNSSGHSDGPQYNAALFYEKVRFTRRYRSTTSRAACMPTSTRYNPALPIPTRATSIISPRPGPRSTPISTMRPRRG
jgi:TonB-dependent receptor